MTFIDLLYILYNIQIKNKNGIEKATEICQLNLQKTNLFRRALTILCCSYNSYPETFI